MRHFILLSFCLISFTSVFSQHFIKGKIQDQDGNPLQGATVTLQNNTKTVSTTADGNFKIDGLTEKYYTVTFSFVGYNTLIQKASTDKELLIVLQSKTYAMNGVTVTSLRATEKSPIAYSNLDKAALSKSNLGQDIPYLLTTTPSLVVTSDAGTGIGYTNFRIRGTDASRINITINGIPYNDPDEQGAYWVDVPDLTSSIENIQVQRGVGTSTNGAAAFGANITIQTENHASEAMAEVAASMGSFNTQKATVKASSGLLKNHWAIDTRISSITSDGYIDRATSDLKSYFIQAGYYDEKTIVKLLTFGGKEKTYHAWDGVDSYALPDLAYERTYNPCGYMGDDANGQPLYYQNQTDNYTQTNYQLLLNHLLSNNFTLNAGLHYTRGDGYYEEYKKDQVFKTYSISDFLLNGNPVTYSDLVRRKMMGNDFAGMVVSLNYQKNNLTAQLGGAINNYWGNHWGDVIWVKNYFGDILPTTEYYRSKVNKFDANIYLKANYEIIPQLNISGDMQYRRVTYNLIGSNDQWDEKKSAMQELSIDQKFNFFNPKVGLYYNQNNNNDYYVSFAVANREPTRTNYTDGTSGSYPTFETLYDTEFGYKFHNELLAVGLNCYYMFYNNQLILTGKINSIGELLTDNIKESFRSGFELTASVKPTPWFKWDASATFSYNRIANFTETVNVIDANWNATGESVSFNYVNVPIAFSPEVLANSLFTFTFDRFQTVIQSIYVGKQFVDNTGRSDRQLPDYFVNNLRFNYSPVLKGLPDLTVTLQINNLFNVMYISNAWSSPSISQDLANPVYNQSSPVVNYFGCYPQAGINFLAGFTVKF